MSIEKSASEAVANPAAWRQAVLDYLRPAGGPAHRAHLFTINGLTYPSHRDFGFAAVPDPHEIVPGAKESEYIEQADLVGGIRTPSSGLGLSIPRSKRRFSMLAYLRSLRKGDLLFFFQALPEWPDDMLNRRGFRGIWVVKSDAFRDVSDIELKSGYKILGTCPGCHTPFDFGEGNLSSGKKCPLCGTSYGSVKVSAGGKTKEYPPVVLSARTKIEPLVIFARTAPDNRVYTDMSVEPMIWISRADNSMGAGKGSSIRTLLPEEASKIAYMLATEDSQSLDRDPVGHYAGTSASIIADHNGVDVALPRVKVSGKRVVKVILEHELHLNYYFARTIDDPSHPLPKMLGLPLSEIDYWTTEFPWGYTADTVDFLVSCWNKTSGRHLIYVFEFKRENIDRDALAEVLLYVPWCVQICTQYLDDTGTVEVVPVLVGRKVTLSKLPADYDLTLNFITSKSARHVAVRTPRTLEYEPIDLFWQTDVHSGSRQYYAKDLRFWTVKLPTASITPPPATLTTTSVEKAHVAATSLSTF